MSEFSLIKADDIKYQMLDAGLHLVKRHILTDASHKNGHSVDKAIICAANHVNDQGFVDFNNQKVLIRPESIENLKQKRIKELKKINQEKMKKPIKLPDVSEKEKNYIIDAAKIFAQNLVDWDEVKSKSVDFHTVVFDSTSTRRLAISICDSVAKAHGDQFSWGNRPKDIIP